MAASYLGMSSRIFDRPNDGLDSINLVNRDELASSMAQVSLPDTHEATIRYQPRRLPGLEPRQTGTHTSRLDWQRPVALPSGLPGSL